MNKLQIMQNIGSRVKKIDHITKDMKYIQWMKIAQHIQLKVVMTMYKCVNGLH